MQNERIARPVLNLSSGFSCGGSWFFFCHCLIYLKISKIWSPIYFPIIATNDTPPIPAISPVVTRKILLLSLLKKACVSPSIYVGNIKAIVHQIFKVKTLNINKGNAM